MASEENYLADNTFSFDERQGMRYAYGQRGAILPIKPPNCLDRSADLVGLRVNYLTVLRRSERKAYGNVLWWVRCDCGTEKEVRGKYLRYGKIISCGCAKVEMSSIQHTKHGGRKLREYAVWARMKARCGNPANKAYQYYGGRGIIVCDRWRESFENFFEDMGLRPSPKHSIDRIDNNGNYEPGNCRWATVTEQNMNRSNSLPIRLQPIADELGITYYAAYQRRARGKL